MEQNQNMGVNREDTYTIDVEHLASSIEATMSQSDLSMSAKRCIFKTPIALSRHNKKAYIPDAFSIGPIHHGRKNLKATETIKAKYLQDLISRSQPFFPNTILLKDFINSINALETDARECYAEPIVCSREEFVKTLVIDGCFIIELLCRFCYEDLREKNDPIFSISSMIEVLWQDLILLENQVPWMVLERLFSMSMAPQCSGITLLQLAIAPINVIFLFPLPVGADLDRQHIKHIPDLLKKLLVSSIEVDEESGSQSDGADLDCQHIIHIPGLLKKLLVSSIEVDEESRSQSANPWILHSATRLKEAGIKFRKSKSKNMFDIKFTKGVLEIPPISIHDKSETIFRNLISFEQCCPDSDDRITSYAKLLNNLISTTKDVEILCENQILNIWLNPKDAVQFFKKLYHDACIQEFYYADLYEQVNKYCQRRWPRYRVVLVHNYFNTPWAILSTSAAAMLLIFTFLQTLYTMKS